jgi:hypothetical protein
MIDTARICVEEDRRQVQFKADFYEAMVWNKYYLPSSKSTSIPWMMAVKEQKFWVPKFDDVRL